MGLVTGCGRTEQTAQTSNDSLRTESAKPRNCQSIVAADKLGKTDEYQESAKPYKFTLTLEQDSSTTDAGSTCYFNNSVTVLATQKSGSQVFKRSLVKDDIRYFVKNGEDLQPFILEKATYQPTFNSQRYIVIQMQLLNPENQQKISYTVMMNYHGEIVKVK